MIISNGRGLTYEPFKVYLECGDDFMDYAKDFKIPFTFSRNFTGKDLNNFIKFIKQIKGVEITTHANNIELHFSSNMLFRFIFKLLRYYRTEEHIKIINEIYKINNKKIPFTGAIILGHFVEGIYWAKSKYSRDMDILRLTNIVIDSGIEYFNKNISRDQSINHFWVGKKHIDIGTNAAIKVLIKLVQEKKYKEAHDYIKN